MKIAFMLLFLAGCGSCKNFTVVQPFPLATDDPDAIAAELIERSTVKISNVYPVVHITPGKAGSHGLAVPAKLQDDGTGVVIGRRKIGEKVQSLILTVGHVSAINPDRLKEEKNVAKFAEPFQFITTIEGNQCGSRQIYISPINDVGIILADCDAGTPVAFSSVVPKPGSKIQTAGCPEGIFPPFSVPFFDGRFSGFVRMQSEDRPAIDMILSIPVFQGMSGSGVFYRGKLIGLIADRTPDFQQIAFGPGLGDVLSAVEAGEKAGWPTK